jgi:hypothetical protein
MRLKTLIEQAAGRVANYHNEKAFTGKQELQRRFGADKVLAASWEVREGEDWINVVVQPADGSKPTNFIEPLEAFPSDECITYIALVT